MRSFLFTIFLLLIATALGGLATWQFLDGSLEKFLGTPPTSIGEKIFPDFNPEDVAEIQLLTGETNAVFNKTETGWVSKAPWQDRMDQRAALAILSFTAGTAAEDLIPREKLDPKLAGLQNGGTQIRLKNKDGETLAFYRLGRRTPWISLTQTEQSEQPEQIPTIYLLPLESGRKSHVYAATGDILPLFKDNFRFLRDHRPFYFNPLALQQIRIKTDQGGLTLGRANPTSPWRITKPLDLPTNPAAVKTLLEGLVTLQATSVTNRSTVTLPSDGSSPLNSQIAITPFGEGPETILEIIPPSSPESRDTKATISDRPETVFTIPLKSEPDLISIADLPLTVNDLRDPTLTNLNIASIRGIAIESATSPTILISREPPSPWVATINGAEQEANEQRLYELLKAATEARAISFETDAAPEDLSPWGLDRPILKLTFLASDNQALGIAFGIDNRGNLYAQRKGSNSIMRLENRFLESVATRPHEWRHSRLWPLSVVDLTEIVRTETEAKPLTLKYDFIGDSWKAFDDDKEITANLDPIRANFLLSTLENLEVDRWLAVSDLAALKALENPSLSFEVTQNEIDDFGDTIGQKTETLTLAFDTTTKTVFGKRSSEESLFTLSAETYLKLSIPLLDQ
ncbi:DUF4340 domain-containing protein [Luteolibacter sp. AS25]|uniref:DUF4340 domain-containing protein n=1 Tax=Luteolibacter sp. AS25 TaxID=3135776 RepID=UPI00398B4126